MSLKPTLEENLRRLRRTSIPTILVEGNDDILLLHWILAKTNSDASNLYVCGSRVMLLNIYDEINKTPESYPSVRLFLADQDMYVFKGIPEKYAGIFFTKGYSIENDLFYDSEIYIDGLLLYPEYLVKKKTILENIIKWYAFEVEDYLRKEDKETRFEEANIRNNQVFSTETLDFTPAFLKNRGFTQPNTALIEDLLKNYALKLRGHTLIQTISLIFLLRKDKEKIVFETVEKGTAKRSSIQMPHYSDVELLNMCFAYSIVSDGSLLNRIVQEINKTLK